MNVQRKIKLKKRIRIYFILGCCMVGFFMLYAILILFSNKLFSYPLANYMSLVLGIILIVVPFFGGFIFIIMSSFCQQELHSYKNSIRLYRTHKFARQILELIQANDIDKAIDIYIKFDLGFDKRLNDYVYGILLGSCKFSGDKKLKELSEKKITALKELYNPDKVQL